MSEHERSTFSRTHKETKISPEFDATFNTFTTNWMQRIENLNNTLILISGGVMSVSITAFLQANKASPLPLDSVCSIKSAWVFFSLSLSLALTLKFITVITGLSALLSMRQVAKAEPSSEKTLHDVSSPIYVLGTAICLFSFVFCLIGIAYTCISAIIVMS